MTHMQQHIRHQSIILFTYLHFNGFMLANGTAWISTASVYHFHFITLQEKARLNESHFYAHDGLVHLTRLTVGPDTAKYYNLDLIKGLKEHF